MVSEELKRREGGREMKTVWEMRGTESRLMGLRGCFERYIDSMDQFVMLDSNFES